MMTKTRLWLGLAVMIAVQLGFGPLVAGLGIGEAMDETVRSAFAFFFGALAGAFVARRRFLVPALVVWAAMWLAVAYMLHQVAAGQSTFLSIVQFNLFAIVASAVAVVLGVVVGQFLAGRINSTAAAAT